MHPSDSGLSPRAIGWALLSQLLWLPLVGIDLHDRWVARQREITPPGKPLPASPIARATPFSLNDLLGAAKPVQQLAGQANQAVSSALGTAVRGAAGGVGVLLSSAGSGASSLLDRPFTVSLDAPSAATAAAQAPGAGQSTAGLSDLHAPQGLLGRAFTRAQLLGGSIGLGDLQEGPMTPLALAERALQRGSGDPLAPIPSLWREPMRQALLKLPGAPQQLSPARIVYVPSSTVSQPVEVPLALQSDGSVDILEAPSNPAVLREIEGWSRQQRLPATGSLQPAIVHLHPLPPVAPLTPASASPTASRPAAAAASRAQAPAASAQAVAAPTRSEAVPAPAPAATPLLPREASSSQAEPAATSSVAIPSDRSVPAAAELPAPAPLAPAAAVAEAPSTAATPAP